MNEYTRREEVKWILLSAITLVACIGASMALLVTARGALVPDPAAKTEAVAAAEKEKTVATCSVSAAKLVKELGVFRNIAAAAQLDQATDAPPVDADPKAPKKPVPRADPRHPVDPKREAKKTKLDDQSGLAWPGASPTYQHAVALAPCRALAEEIGPSSAKAAEGWKAIEAGAAVSPPAEGDKGAQVAAAKQVYAALHDAPVDEVSTQLAEASTAAAARSRDAAEKAASATIRTPLPQGLLGREAALGGGVVICLVALLISFFSLRATSQRRKATLVELRGVAQTAQRGLQAAAIIRLASESNGGEPGLVMGAALGGCAAALATRLDADWFVVGVMGGLVLGVLIQIVFRTTGGESGFRERAMELSDVEKPTVPIILALSSVQRGRETEFLDAFMRLSPQESAMAVEKLAAEAEERILVAADAQAGV